MIEIGLYPFSCCMPWCQEKDTPYDPSWYPPQAWISKCFSLTRAYRRGCFRIDSSRVILTQLFPVICRRGIENPCFRARGRKNKLSMCDTNGWHTMGWQSHGSAWGMDDVRQRQLLCLRDVQWCSYACNAWGTTSPKTNGFCGVVAVFREIQNRQRGKIDPDENVCAPLITSFCQMPR